MVWAWLSAALATVTVDDATGCLDLDRVDNELRLLLGDALVDHLDIQVTTRDPLDVKTTVREDDRTLWSKTATYTAPDCPAIPEAIALSVQQGLRTVPGWTFDPPVSRRTLAPTVNLTVSGGLPLDGRFAVHLGGRWNLARPLSLWAQARGQTGPPVRVGSGAATIVHPAVALGPVLHSQAPFSPELWVLGSAGPLFAFGSRFDTDQIAVLPRAAVEIGAGLYPGGPAHVGLFTEIPVLRTRLVEIGGPARNEPAFRVGITFGLDFSNPK